MFAEIAITAALCAFIPLAALILTGRGYFEYLMFIFLAVAVIFLVMNQTIPWQHETKIITVLDKFTAGSTLYVAGDDGVTYTIRNKDPEVYSKLRINTSYSMDVAHNYDGEGVLGSLAAHNIDRVNWG